MRAATTHAPESDTAALEFRIDTERVFDVSFPLTPVTESARGIEVQDDDFKGGESSQSIFQPTRESEDLSNFAEVVDDADYLRLDPDVKGSTQPRQFETETGYAHDERPTEIISSAPYEARNVMLESTVPGQPDFVSVQARSQIETLLLAPSGGVMIVGWIDDIVHRIDCIRIISPRWRVLIDASRLVRIRRRDVEKALGSVASHPFGFIGFVHFEHGGEISGPVTIELWLEGGASAAVQCDATIVGDVELRSASLACLADASFFGNRSIESMGYLSRGLGADLIRLNNSITRRLVVAPYVERFGSQNKSARGTIVVCIYGRPEFYFVQNCLFSGLPGIDEYEFIYVCNSPELAEPLLREARCASLIYGLTNSVVILPDNAGFGGANNVAARMARSDRLLFVNPDVFPRDRDWAKKHSDLLNCGGREQTRLFGVPLYYDDGSLMHGGMYFDIDVGVTFSTGTPSGRQICRVEHYGKGAPADSPQFTRPRAVPAVTGAFLSIERQWFEELGGFTGDFIFGHYEDADLCLKSIEKGVAPWLQDIRMWHLEGKGSTRQLAHEGGSLVNRWLFSETWMSTIEAGLQGPAPTHSLFQQPTSALSPTAQSELKTPKSDRRRGSPG